MLVEKKLSDAIKAHETGKRVVVIQEMEDGSIFSAPFEDFFDSSIHCLVDVIAYENPEFSNLFCEGVNKMEESEDKDIDLKEEVKTPVPEERSKSKLEIVKELLSQGKTAKEIADITGFDKNLVYQYKYKLGQERNNVERCQPGHNADRHLCITCTFRGKSNKGIGCEYALHNNHTRGCSIEDCNVYKKGDPERITKAPVLY